MAVILLKLSDEQKEAIKEYAKLHKKSVNQIVLDTVLEKMEDEEDYALAVELSKNVNINECIDFETLCKECGINQETL